MLSTRATKKGEMLMGRCQSTLAYAIFKEMDKDKERAFKELKAKIKENRRLDE